MKFASFDLDGRVEVGQVDAEKGRLYPLGSMVRDMVDLIERYDALRPGLPTQAEGLPLDRVRLLAPLPWPRRNIFCVGKNYREHAREFAQSGFEAGAVKGQEIDEFPAVFTKPASSVVGPGATVELHPGVTSKVDYEAELAVVIGSGGRGIRRENAYRHIWGYTIINDVTARDRQRNHKQWFLGKALDTFCPMGPWIATADEVDPENLDVRCWVNGDLRQDANTRDLIFDIPNLVETISAGLTLEPGDIISTGTPAGVGIGLDPPRFLKAGDTVTISITGLGTLTNTFG
jgi:2-keto-4-pentenoate hydratase/2-oxohepta-3-ene-1,7-dioic acid hydratase in catechol pathway